MPCTHEQIMTMVTAFTRPSRTKSEVQEVKDEFIRDTLIDLANYAIMTVLELDDLKAEEHADER